MRPESARPRAEQALSLCLLGFAIVGCATPLAKVVKADAPGFRIKAPARGDHELGRHVEDGQAVPQICFVGTRKSEGFGSWSAREFEYDAALSAQVTADFGKTLKPTSSAGVNRRVAVTLDSVRVVAIDDLYATGCAQLTGANSDFDESFSVVTQALSAGRITLAQEDGVELELKLDTKVVGGTVDVDTQQRDAWVGANLYFADLLQRFKVTRLRESARLGVGGTVDIGSCGFTLLQVDRQSWKGRASCQNIPDTAQLGGGVGDFGHARFSGGIAITVRITNPGLSEGDVEAFRFEVEPVR